uniref:Uncharacterized protein n=1 Tax=Siphoviridae sp. ctljn1 TaxID=2826448 RepID=A0A8S5R0R4_9CAUD|nr:MAG TPA: hypothetical protein [Siphoviridae sp. ctljn1]
MTIIFGIMFGALYAFIWLISWALKIIAFSTVTVLLFMLIVCIKYALGRWWKR